MSGNDNSNTPERPPLRAAPLSPTAAARHAREAGQNPREGRAAEGSDANVAGDPNVRIPPANPGGEVTGGPAGGGMTDQAQTAQGGPQESPAFTGDKALDGGAPAATVASTSNQRTTNNVMRHEYRILTDAEKKHMQDVKDLGVGFVEKLFEIGGTPIFATGQKSRELSIAQTKIEEAVMWAVKHITR